MLPSLIQTIQIARSQKQAIGHFNISTIDNLWSVYHAARSLNVPVIIGVSEGERDFIGPAQVAALVFSIRQANHYPIYLNADHTYTFDRVKEVIDLGYDSVIVDGASKPLTENIALTKQCVDYAKKQDHQVLVEAEIGYIGTSSALLDSIPDTAIVSSEQMPSASLVADFVQATGVDLVSSAVGNIHGMLKNSPNPNLNLDLISQISSSISVPFVLHGGSGITDAQFVEAIDRGVSLIHINTDLRRTWRSTLEHTLSDDPDQVSPYKLLSPTQDAVQAVVTRYLRLFSRR